MSAWEEVEGILSADEMRQLQTSNPAALLQYLNEVRQNFLFGVRDHREEGEDRGWGGECSLSINRNLVLHLVPGYGPEMSEPGELPQFCVFPDDDRADTSEETTLVLDDGQEVRGVVFYVDHDDYDLMLRDAARIAEEYPGWEVIPDSYFLDAELLHFLRRTVLEHPVIRAEREFDFKRGMPLGAGFVLPEGERELSAEELIARGTPEPTEPLVIEDEPDETSPKDDDGDDDDPLEDEGMRSHPLRWG